MEPYEPEPIPNGWRVRVPRVSDPEPGASQGTETNQKQTKSRRPDGQRVQPQQDRTRRGRQ